MPVKAIANDLGLDNLGELGLRQTNVARWTGIMQMKDTMNQISTNSSKVIYLHVSDLGGSATAARCKSQQLHHLWWS